MPVEPMADSVLKEIHKEIRTGLKKLMTGRADKSEAWMVPAPEQLGISRGADVKSRMQFEPETSFGDQKERIVILNAALNVLFTGQRMIRVCKECGNPFVPRRRQEYDTPACSQRVRDRKRKPKKKVKKALKKTG
jgi:hypothetical protein